MPTVPVTVTLPVSAVSVTLPGAFTVPVIVIFASVALPSVLNVTLPDASTLPVRAIAPAFAVDVVVRLPVNEIVVAVTSMPPLRVVIAGKVATFALDTVKVWSG